MTERVDKEEVIKELRQRIRHYEDKALIERYRCLRSTADYTMSKTLLLKRAISAIENCGCAK